MARLFEFGEFVFDAHSGELRSNGEARFLQPQPARVLALLLENRGALVDRERIESELWPAGNPAAEQGINACIRQLRRAVGDDAREPTFIETVPRRGYRFMSQVGKSGDAPRDSTLHRVADGTARSIRWRTVAGMLVATVGLVVWALAAATSSSGDGSADIVRLAVLGLEDLDDDPWNRRFASGLTEELIATLGQMEPTRLRVVSPTESMRLRNAGKPLYVIGAELRADYVVEGGVRRSGDDVRVTVRLVAVGDQAPSPYRTAVWMPAASITASSSAIIASIEKSNCSRSESPAPTGS